MSFLLTDARKSGDAGYFRIGDVILTIPPEEISTNKDINNEELIPFRSRFPMFRKTGHARLDCTISWKALAQEKADGTLDYSEWTKLRRILAMFVAAPFVEVENGHLRQIVMDSDSQFNQGDRMGFALRQLRVDTLPDIVDGVQVSLTMCLFNYKPYSSKFGFTGKGPTGTEANRSSDFSGYLDSWIAGNLPNQEILKNYPVIQDWQSLETGSMRLFWRIYDIVQRTDLDNSSASSSGTDSTTANSAAKKNTKLQEPIKAPADIKKIIQAAATKYGVDPNLALALAQHESGFDPKARNPTSDARGLFQFVPIARKQYNLSADDAYDPTKSSDAGCHMIQDLVGWNKGDVVKVLLAYYQGQGALNKYGVQGLLTLPKYAKYTVPYVADVTNILSKLSGKANVGTTALATAANSTPASTLPTPTLKTGTPSTDILSSYKTASGNALTDKLNDGWTWDYHTERCSFVYQEHELSLSQDDFDNTQSSGMQPTQVSVVFVNNVAQIPLAAYQYPTQQHVGPAGTMISIDFLSNGERDSEDSEPTHPGLSTLSGAVSNLENQFLQFKSAWKSVASMQRMQAVVIENQVLNMLGIYGVIPQTLSTAIVPESCDMVQAKLICSQYENVFEKVAPFMVKGSKEYEHIWVEQVMSGKIFETLRAKNGKTADHTLDALTTFLDKRDKRDLSPIFDYLTQAKSYRVAPLNYTPGPSWNIFKQTVKAYGYTYLRENFPTLADRFDSSEQLSMNDVVLCSHSYSSTTTISDIVSRVKAAAAAGSFDPIEALYNDALVWFVGNNAPMASAVEKVMATPELQALLIAAVDPKGPGGESDNQDHLCYRDLGLRKLSDQPASYFVDESAKLKEGLRNSASEAIKITTATSTYFNKLLDSSSDHDAKTIANASDKTVTVSKTGAAATETDQTNRAEEILKNVVIPFYSMARAFPTIKLFLLEEDNSERYYAFDDFYSYASLLNVEVIRHKDKPDTAVLQISNLANLLSYKLFDGSIEGKLEWSKSRNIKTSSTVTSDGSAVSVNGVSLAAQLEKGSVTNLAAGYDESGKRVQHQVYALQAGSKMQIRVGFSNNPDELYPIFSGLVTQIAGTDILTVTAQGFGLELFESTPEDLSYNGFGLACVGNLGTNVLSAAGQVFEEVSIQSLMQGAGLVIRGFGRAPLYGGTTPFGGGGDACSVIKAMVKSSKAKHFGHWQLAVPTGDTTPLRGFGWLPALGSVMSTVGMTRVGGLFQSYYDRSGDNIFLTDLEGSDVNSGNDPWMETGGFSNPAYSVPVDSDVTPWRIIQDVRRRFPSYILAVKPYGFPFGCDATLVFASPNSNYVCRMPLATEAEGTSFKPEDTAGFMNWWNSGGKATFLQLADYNTGKVPWARHVSTFLYSDASAFWDWSAYGPYLASKISSGGSKAGDIFNQIITSGMKFATRAEATAEMWGLDNMATYESSTLNNIGAAFMAADRTLDNLANLSFMDRAKDKQVAQNLRTNLYNLQSAAVLSVKIFRKQDTTKGPTLPVRKWHVVTSLNIIHNGIELNDDVYNAVRVNDHLFSMNANLERFASNMKMLDVDKLVIDPQQNVGGTHLWRNYAGSFLKDETSKIYTGELVLTGQPEIDPFDILIISDSTTGITGQMEVESVIHSFDQENGFITIVKPRALVSVNECFTAGIGQAIWGLVSNFGDEASGIFGDRSSSAGESVAKFTVASGLAAAGATVVLAGGTWALALLGLVAFKGFMWAVDKRRDLCPILVSPLSRYGVPWVAGMDGYAIGDLHSWVKDGWEMFNAYELAPTLRAFREITGYGIQPGESTWYSQNVTPKP